MSVMFLHGMNTYTDITVTICMKKEEEKSSSSVTSASVKQRKLLYLILLRVSQARLLDGL